jgi:hypothetical protein
MVGILVHGNNHFILSGLRPDQAQALLLARHFSLFQIGTPKPQSFERWQIRDQEFRENLEWAAIVPAERDRSPGVAQLLAELDARGIVIDHYDQHCW